MENTNTQPESRLREYLKHLRFTLWGIFPPVAATMLAAPLQNQFHIPQPLTYAVGFGAWAVQFFLYCRHVWQQTANEKQELQKRFATEDAVLFGGAQR